MKRWNGLLHTLFTEATGVDDGLVPDAQLVDRFTRGDAAAFELLLRRHARAVFGTCARVCRDVQDAEDAFQATFLILARKAASLRRVRCLAGWLHRVAQRTATRAARQRARKQQREQALVVDPPAQAGSDDRNELHALLDAEINRLPERYRLPVILCYLHGSSTEAAAQRLGIPRGTVLSRLATARQKLAVRLTRRGVTVSVTAAGLFGVGVPCAVCAGLIRDTARVVLVPSTTPTRAALLAREIIQMATWNTRLVWALSLAAVLGLGGGIWGLTAGGNGQPMPGVAIGKAAAEEPPPSEDRRRGQAQQPGFEGPGVGAVQDKRADEAEKARAERERKEREVRKQDTIRKLERDIGDLEDAARTYQARIREQSAVRPYPNYDEKTLMDAIASIDRQRFETEDKISRFLDIAANSPQVKDLKEGLVKLNDRRQELVRRLRRQQMDKAEWTRQLEDLEKEKARYEDQAAQLRDYLFRVRYDLGPRQSSAVTEETLGRLLKEVADLKKEVRRLTEEKK
jgi:RNA polymerase sigma factor (sigma-70 family)